MNITDAAVGAAAAAIQVRMERTIGLNDLARAALEAALPYLLTADPLGTEWGVASKWGSHAYITQALALEAIDRHHTYFEDAHLVKRAAAPAVKPGPWEETS